MKKDPSHHFAPSALRQEAARRLGYRLENLDPGSGYLFTLEDGRRKRVMVHGLSPLNDAASARLAGDKYFTAVALRHSGFRVPDGVRCLAEGAFQTSSYPEYTGLGEARRFAEERGFPLVVKPNRGARGRDVTLAHDLDGLEAAVTRVWEHDYLALVQERISGFDLRLDFLGDTFLLGYTRQPVHLQGDGRSSLAELLVATDPRFRGAALEDRLRGDIHWQRQVVDQGWNLETILPAGKELVLSDDILNLNRLCVAQLVHTLPPNWLAHGLAIGKSLHLRHFGIDFKLPAADPDLTSDPAAATILEVNASPSLRQTFERGEVEAAVGAQMRVLQAILDGVG